MAHFSIGDAVCVFRVRTVGYKNNVGGIRSWDERTFGTQDLKHPLWGQITGKKVAYEGYRTFDGDDAGNPVFHPNKAVTFWCVRFGMRNKEVLVTEEDISQEARIKLPEAYYTIPEVYQNSPRWTPQDRKALSDDIKKYAKRDSKGRFVKCP